MTVFKNNSGFTLIEVMLALAIVTLLLTPVFMVSWTVMQRSSRSAHTIERFLAQKKFLSETEYALDASKIAHTAQKNLARPATRLEYALRPISENSALKKFKNVQVELVTARWTDRTKKNRSDSLVTLLYKEEPHE